MRKDRSRRELACYFAGRSPCNVQVGAVLTDKQGRLIHGGWNNPGNGFGMCAEEHAIKRANPKRLYGSTLTITSFRKKNGNPVFCQPCENCFTFAKKRGVEIVEHNDKNGNWIVFELQYAKLNLKKLKRRKN
ncbi:MAG: hypothetical protein AAB527_02675 [Patescibacteria group bacterium]